MHNSCFYDRCLMKLIEFNKKKLALILINIAVDIWNVLLVIEYYLKKNLSIDIQSFISFQKTISF